MVSVRRDLCTVSIVRKLLHVLTLELPDGLPPLYSYRFPIRQTCGFRSITFFFFLVYLVLKASIFTIVGLNKNQMLPGNSLLRFFPYISFLFHCD